MKTVGNISDTISRSEFVLGVAGGAGAVGREAPALVTNTVSLAHNSAQV